MAPDRLLELLQCPKCRTVLSSFAHCPGCDTTFPASGRQPVLIDFEDSIFQPSAYLETNAPVPHQEGTKIGRLLSRLTYGGNELAERTVDSFLESLSGLSNPRVLIVGGGTIGAGAYALYANPELELIGTDVYASDDTCIVCDGHKLPFRDSSFDAVFIQAVLEHVLEPQRVVDEIHRVLKEGGVVLAQTPFLQQVHMGAYDFTRFTHSGHRWLFRKFDQIEAGAILGPGITLIWSIAHMARSIGLGTKGATLIAAAFFWLRLLDRFVSRQAMLDGASGLYFLGRRAERKLKPYEMVSYYEGSRLDPNEVKEIS